MIRHITLLSILSIFAFVNINAQQLDKKSFYTGLSSDNLETINSEITKVEKLQNANAYKGALLMRKAGSVNGPANKLKLFKEGRLLLEEEIAKNPDNVEYRFLRLMIQENAPRILGYNKQVEEDVKLLEDAFSGLPDAVKEVVRDYQKKSKALSASTFN